MSDEEKQSTPAKKEPTFEQALAELEELVRKMETGQLPLDRMIEYYEKGGKLASYCRKQLDSLEKKISVLSGKESDGSARWENFDSANSR